MLSPTGRCHTWDALAPATNAMSHFPICNAKTAASNATNEDEHAVAYVVISKQPWTGLQYYLHLPDAQCCSWLILPWMDVIQSFNLQKPQQMLQFHGITKGRVIPVCFNVMYIIGFDARFLQRFCDQLFLDGAIGCCDWSWFSVCHVTCTKYIGIYWSWFCCIGRHEKNCPTALSS